jgi:hypothetical protein
VRREDLLHVVHAAATITEETEIVVIGSQSILGSYESPPDTMLHSMEGTFGYYAHGVGPETAKPPEGWFDRLVRVPVPLRTASDVAAVALCLEPHDLILSKLAANRPRDWDFARDAWAAGLLRADVLRARAHDLPVRPELRHLIVAGVEAILAT